MIHQIWIIILMTLLAQEKRLFQGTSLVYMSITMLNINLELIGLYIKGKLIVGSS